MAKANDHVAGLCGPGWCDPSTLMVMERMKTSTVKLGCKFQLRFFSFSFLKLKKCTLLMKVRNSNREETGYTR